MTASESEFFVPQLCEVSRFRDSSLRSDVLLRAVPENDKTLKFINTYIIVKIKAINRIYAIDCFYFDNNIGIDEFERFVIFGHSPQQHV